MERLRYRRLDADWELRDIAEECPASYRSPGRFRSPTSVRPRAVTQPIALSDCRVASCRATNAPTLPYRHTASEAPLLAGQSDRNVSR
jgi:hypothetical protein